MKPEIIFTIFLLCFLLMSAAVYFAVRAAWERIDFISGRTVELIQSRYDAEFDPVRFRKYISTLMLPGDYKIIFHSPFYERSRHNEALNAYTGLPGTKLIVFSPGWAVRLSQKEDRALIKDLFIFALGHEITHREQPRRPIFLFGRRRRCVDWIREIHADFGGLRKSGLPCGRVSVCVREEILRKRKHIYASQFSSMNSSANDVRLSKKNPSSNAVYSARTRHPSWEYRMQCWETGQMETVIDRICEDCEIKSRRFRDQMVVKYKTCCS